jgi:hypothetical protein
MEEIEIKPLQLILIPDLVGFKLLKLQLPLLNIIDMGKIILALIHKYIGVIKEMPNPPLKFQVLKVIQVININQKDLKQVIIIIEQDHQNQALSIKRQLIEESQLKTSKLLI